MKWNLDVIYKSWSEFDQDAKKVKDLTKKIIGLQGTLDTLEGYQEFNKTLHESFELVERIYFYSHLKSDLNKKDEFNLSKHQEALIIYNGLAQSLSWVEPELLTIGEDKINEYFKLDPSLASRKHEIENLFRLQEHVLSKEQESIISNFYSIDSQSELYNSLAIADAKNETVDLSNQKNVLITSGNYRSLLQSTENADDRRIIFEAAFKKYKEYKNTFAAIYDKVLKTNLAFSNSRNYSSILESRLFQNNIPTSVYLNLIRVTRDNTDLLKRYYAIRKKYFKLEEVHTYDRFLTFATSNKKYTYEEARSLFFDSIKAMPKEFTDKAKSVLEDGYVDVFEADGKSTGAYSSAVYEYHPYILLNFDGTLDSAFTIAHEAGHSIHSMLSNQYQPRDTADYLIFVAEIASTFNEHNLLDYLITKATSKEEKLVLLEQAINDICATFFRQSLFATYEYEAHQLVEKGMPITAQVLSNIMIQLYKDYYDIDITKENGKENVWAYIPHLTHTPFYVYQYATSFSASLKLYENIKNDCPNAMDNYLNLLKSGGSDYPIELVKKAGVDLSTNEPFEAVIRRFKVLLDELEKTLTY